MTEQGSEPVASAGGPTRRRWLPVAAVAGALLIVVAFVTVVLVVARDGGPAGEFAEASDAFHSRLDQLSSSMEGHLSLAREGFGDPEFRKATTDAKALADLYDGYNKDVQAIEVPDAAESARAALLRATEAGRILMVNAAGFFSKSAMKTALDRLWPQVKTALTRAEDDLRAALSG